MDETGASGRPPERMNPEGLHPGSLARSFRLLACRYSPQLLNEGPPRAI
jgi:hypothetical protein